MPELPEVESHARALRKTILNRPIKEVWIGWRRTIARPTAAKFIKELAGRRVVKILRRGKFIIMQLDNGLSLVSHFRMTGHFRLAPIAESKSTKEWYILPDDPFTRVAMRLDKNEVLHFSDIRKFARLWLVTKEQLEKMPELAKLGPEPLEKRFTAEVFTRCLHNYKGMVKPTLLDQRCIAGIGNIYADESLFDANIHPKTRVDKLSDKEINKLYHAVVKNLAAAVKHRGSSIGEFINMKGDKGGHGPYLRVYGKSGKACQGRRNGKPCKGKISRIVVAQRGTHLCKACQKIKR